MRIARSENGSGWLMTGRKEKKGDEVADLEKEKGLVEGGSDDVVLHGTRRRERRVAITKGACTATDGTCSVRAK